LDEEKKKEEEKPEEKWNYTNLVEKTGSFLAKMVGRK